MNSELLLVVIPSTVAVLGIFQDSFRASSYRTALEAAVEMSEPFVGTARIRDAPGASPTRSFFRSGSSGKLRKVRRVEGEYLADTSGEV
jgi:hypothetical protein